MASVLRSSQVKSRKNRPIEPNLGGRHGVVIDSELDLFFELLDRKWRRTVREEDPRPGSMRRDRQPKHVVYNNPELIGMTVLEYNLTAKHAERMRVKWTQNDLGRIHTELKDELAKLEKPDDLVAPITQVVTVGGDYGANKLGRMVAAIVQPNSEVADYMIREHEILVDSMSANIKGFEYPHEEYVPKLTLGRIQRSVGSNAMGLCIDRAQQMLTDNPVAVQMEPINIYTVRDDA